MSGAGTPQLDLKAAGGLRVAVVAASWHVEVMDGLVSSAQRRLDEIGAAYDVVRVPGTFELPVVAKALASSGYDAVVALGVVCSAATDGLTRVAIDTGVPIGFGVLTCDDEAQALDRAGLPGSHEDKGREAVEAALSTVLTLRALTPTASVGFTA